MIATALANFKKTEVSCFIFLVALSAFLRFPQLGYSHFYGDETKVLYVDKTIPAVNFFLDQRKGPIQFLVAWIMEKMSGGFDEGVIRFPFALAGFLAIFVFYFAVRKLFDWRVGFISALLFSLNGFFIAFSRTVQYQSFMLLFGLLSIVLALFCTEQKNIWLQRIYLMISAIFLGLAMLSHYDAVFLALPVLLILFMHFRMSKGQVYVYFLLPFFITVGLFYIPYITSGYFVENTLGYLQKRLSGETYLPHSSYETFKIYNPSFGIPVVYAFSVIAMLFKRTSRNVLLVLLWFFFPFVLFEFLFSNPGTHILNYFVPLTILSAIGIVWFFESFINRYVKYAFISAGAVLIVSIFSIQTSTFVPAFNTGYPWNSMKIMKDKYQLFLYGFPYYRGWDRLATFFAESRPRSFYTNDNIVMSEYYLNGVSVVKIYEQQLPEYYFDVLNNQEFKQAEPYNLIQQNYSLLDQEVLPDMKIYKLNK